ncbi:hypothetical protein [Streptomyces sp. NPDC018059]|uniref:hypothetical protein n=1 Tax=Streptomyces sp. NPDC018059 TaxID=3365041 RepID=UPI0037A54163
MRNPARGHELVALRRLNTTVVLRPPSRRSPRTRAEPAAGSGLPQSTVEAAVEEATGRGLAGDPEVILLTGGATPVGRHPVPLPEERLRLVTPHVPLSSLGERGVALGAVRKALDHVEEELLADTAP